MKRLKFFGLSSLLLILALVLVIKSDFISDVWAKPPYAEYKTSNGYAKLADTSGYLIQSDSGRQYIDSNIRKTNGEDRITITTNKTTGAYVKSFTVLGIVEYESSRRVRFLFDLDDCSRLIGDKAVFDILIWKGASKASRRGNNHSGKWYLDDGTPRFRVIDYTSSAANDSVAFIVDPGWDGTSPDAITQTTVNSFYGGDTDEYETSIYGHVIYYLGYPSGISATGSSPTWTFSPSGEPTLYVKKKVGDAWENVNLATYASIPFNLTISLNSIP